MEIGGVMTNGGCFGPTGRCQLTSPCAFACVLRVQPLHSERTHGFHQGAQPLRQLTESDVRRIVREELALAAQPQGGITAPAGGGEG